MLAWLYSIIHGRKKKKKKKKKKKTAKTNTQVVENDTVPTMKLRYSTGQFLGFSGSFGSQSISKAGSDEGTRERAWESPILGVDMINRGPGSGFRKP